MAQTRFLTLEQVLRLHQASINTFGGAHGLRDKGALESALAMPEAGFGNDYLHNTTYEKAAAYLYHIVKNHPFVDGNKRTGFGCADIFLRVNGHTLQTTFRQNLTALTLRVATEPITKEEIAELLEKWCL
jgi:death on curing protein